MTLQCSGNRRSHFAPFRAAQGIPWSTGAVRPRPAPPRARAASSGRARPRRGPGGPRRLGLRRVSAPQVSTAHFAGVRLRDVLARCGAADLEAAGAAHVHFVALDEMLASIPADKVSGFTPPSPPPRTNRTRLVPSPVLTGHAASLTCRQGQRLYTRPARPYRAPYRA
jgi:DMSO/TMAO reductase YedYZ molybdopterin-dependent catalytic subunit